jgi:hypothetical protein
MLRPMTSVVSALSGCVANSHQAIHLVSSAPSKIPYGGFSPVRLQTSLTQQPPSSAKCSPLIGCHCSCPCPQRFIRNRTCVQAALRALTRTTDPVALGSPTGSSVRPAHRLLWPHLRLCRPPGRLMNYSARLRVNPASRRGSPIYSASPFTPCRYPYSGGPSDCIRRCLHRWFCLRHSVIGSATTWPTNPEQVGRLTKLQHSLYATAWTRCLPCSGQDFYYRACLGRVAPETQVGYDWMVHRQLPSPDSHRLD